MKRLFFLLILFIAVFHSQNSHANPLCDITEVIERMNIRLKDGGVLLGNKLDGLIKGNAKIQSHPRFGGRPGYTPEMAAIEDISLSLGNSEVVAPGLVGDKTAEKWVDIATSDRVVDAQDVTYLTQGSALGRIANAGHAQDLNADDLVAEILESRRLNFNNTSQPWGSSYNEAHYLRDMDVVLENAPADSNLLGFLNEQKAATAGSPFEARLAASRHQEGIVKFSNDAEYHGVDLETNAAMYNAGLTSHTILGKLNTPEKIDKLASAINRAAKLPNGGKPYKFVCAVKDPDLEVDLNASLAILNSKLDSGIPNFSFSDILVESF